MNFTREKSEDGVTERLFDLTVAGERVPAVLWAPESAKGPRPLVLMGHGGSQHKKIGTLAARARQYAKRLGYAVAAIDAPGHGDRVSREEAARLANDIARASASGVRCRPKCSRRWPSARNAPSPNGRRHSTPCRRSISSARAPSVIGASRWARRSACRSWRASRASSAQSSASPDCVRAPRRLRTRPARSRSPWSSCSSGTTRSRRAKPASPSSTPSARRKKRCTSIPGGYVAIPNFEGAHWQSFFLLPSRHRGGTRFESGVRVVGKKNRHHPARGQRVRVTQFSLHKKDNGSPGRATARPAMTPVVLRETLYVS